MLAGIDLLGSWRQFDERYENVLVDAAGVLTAPAVLGIEATVGEERPPGPLAVAGRRR